MARVPTVKSRRFTSDEAKPSTTSSLEELFNPPVSLVLTGPLTEEWKRHLADLDRQVDELQGRHDLPK